MALTIFFEYGKIAMKEKIQEKRENYFRMFLWEGEILTGKYGFPQLKRSDAVPHNPLSFVESRTKRRLNNRWVHFYAEDLNFECVWNNPKGYIKLLKRFEGAITPDFSLYGDLPRAYQIWNCFRNRALAVWLQRSGINIVPSVSWSDTDSFEWCFDGIPTGGTVSVSANGCYYNPFARKRFIAGFEEMRRRLRPNVIVGVGYIPKELRSTSELLLLPGYSQQRAVRNG